MLSPQMEVPLVRCTLRLLQDVFVLSIILLVYGTMLLVTQQGIDKFDFSFLRPSAPIYFFIFGFVTIFDCYLIRCTEF